MKFTEFSLHEDLLKGIAKAGYETCTPVQDQVIKIGLNKQDLYVQSQTGTGKTAAYLITIIQEMLLETSEEHKQALVMVPTRELAVQVKKEAQVLLFGTQLKSGSFYGGVGYGQQVTLLKEGIDILIGTPGRVIDLNESGQMKLNNIGYLVIDEADRMFDMGFYPDLRKLIKVLPASIGRQTLLFSATLNTYVKNLAWEYTNDAKEIEIESKNITVNEIKQMIFHVPSDEKMKLLLGIINKEKPESIIVFCNTKRACEVIAQRIKLNGLKCEFIIGDLPQKRRLQVLDSFKRGSLKALVATDIAARGIDVDNLSMVINYDLPNEAENYVHRIGRTARAGKTGTAYTFCSEQDVYNLPAIKRYVGSDIPSQVATQDMYSEDKSAGTYIRTGNYNDNRYGDRDSKNHGQSSGRTTTNRNNSHYNSNNHSSTNHSSNSQTSKNTGNRTHTNASHDNYEAKNRQKNYQSKDTTQNNNNKRTTVTRDMSQMSFDERMNVYRKKYSNPADRIVSTTERKPTQEKHTNNKNTNAKKSNYDKKPTSHNNQEPYNKNKSTPTSKIATQKKPRKGVGNIFTRIFTLPR